MLPMTSQPSVVEPLINQRPGAIRVLILGRLAISLMARPNPLIVRAAFAAENNAPHRRIQRVVLGWKREEVSRELGSISFWNS